MPECSSAAWLELSADLRVRELSGAAGQLYGLDVALARGRPLADLLASDHGPIDWEALLTEARGGSSSERLTLHRSSTGVRVWVHARLEARDGGAQLWVRRATGREVVEQQPGGLASAIGRMLAVGGVGLWLDDRVTDEFDWSEHARALHDIPTGVELTPAVLFGQIHPDDRSQAARDIQRGIAEHTPYDGVLRVKQGADGYRSLHVFGGAVYDAAGLALCSVGGVRDLTEQQALERRVRELENQLRAAQRGDVVGRLAGGIAHDFNNILTGILGCCEMVSDDTLSPRQKSDLQQIRAATLRAADLTRQLLAFGRRQALRRQAVEPKVISSEVLALLRRTLPENVEMQLEVQQCPGRVLVDVTQLHQVLTNLVVNAAQAMPDGGKIAISVRQLSVTEANAGQERAGDYICFAVDDTGPGVPSELRARIFEPFFSTKAPGQGSGLGLSVVQGIVEQHQGHLRVAAGALGGARFEVYLPVTEQPPEPLSESPEPRSERPPRGLSVLLVEDEKMVRELTKRVLGGAGYRVLEAADAESALELAARAPFDILLTDVVLPALSGPELVVQLRARGHEFRVIYMSGYPADFVESRVQLAPSDVLVHKPFTAASLLDALGRRSQPERDVPRGQF